jgi:hypothetical protein
MARDKAKHAAAVKAWREANKEKITAYQRAWFEANKERKAATDKAWRAANKERMAAADKAWYAANKERKAAYCKAWRAANPERTAAHHRKRITGWTQEQYDEKLREQGHRCGICGVDKCRSGKAFAADHCHETGKQRGVLCANCNTAIGKLGDNAAGVLRAVSYLLAYEVETKWEPITNDDNTIDASAINYTPDLQQADQR